VNNQRPGLEPPEGGGDYLPNIRTMVDLTDFLELWVAKPEQPPGHSGARLPATLVLHRSEQPFDIGRDEPMGFAGDPAYALSPQLTARGRLVAAMDLFGHATRKNVPNQRRWKSAPERPILFPALRYIEAGTSLLERTVHEVRCVIAYLRGRDDVDPLNIELIGFETGGFAALTAAALEPAVRRVTAVGGVTTQAAAIARELTDNPFLYQPNLLALGDVDAALALLAPKPCRLALFADDPRWPVQGARRVETAMRHAYERADATDSLEICWLPGAPRMDGSITNWVVGSDRDKEMPCTPRSARGTSSSAAGAASTTS
jgi:dienelactone hydrolase